MNTVKEPNSREQEFTALVQKYQLSLLKLCTLYLHNEESAKDAVQDTFIKAYLHRESFRAEASEATWLTRIAINVCKNLLRTNWLRRVDTSVAFESLPEPAAPDEQAERELTVELMRLPRKLREVALLCWLQGFRSEEAAQILGVSRQTVCSRLNRARAKLRTALKGCESNEK